MNWDLIPGIALDRLELLPGSNPLFGLNALGGALALRSKDGFRNPGGSAELSTGSHGQRGAQAEHGGADGPWAWYFAGNAENDDGWREHSPSRVRQGFGRLSWQDEATHVDFSFGAADNRLTGNGAAPEQLLRADRDAVFTYPDRTDNRASQATLGLEQRLSDTLSVAGNLHFRRTHTRTLNGDASDYEDCNDGSGALCNEDGATVLGLDGAAVPAGDDTDSAVRHHSRLDQTASGFDVQATLSEPLFGRRNRLTVGAALEIGDRIPGLPEHQLRLSAAYRLDEHWTLSGEVIADSNRIFRGDESNTDRPLPGYGLLNLRLRVDNVFDRRYANFGVYGDAGEVLGDDYTDARRFVSPGAPRTLSLSAGLTF